MLLLNVGAAREIKKGPAKRAPSFNLGLTRCGQPGGG